MSALEAARLGDQIGHTSALGGLLVGVLAGLAIAVAVVAIVGTGGVAAVAIGAGIAASGAAGGLAGEYIGEMIPTSPTGAIVTGSPNVFTEGPPAARAEQDMALCDGSIPFFKHGTPLIAQGSSTVFINGTPAARKTDKLTCGAAIRETCRTVFIGGETVTVLDISPEVPAWLHNSLIAVMVVGTIIATGGAAAVFGWGPALGALGGGLVGSYALGWVGGKAGRAIGGYFGNAELGARIGEVAGSFAGGLFGARVGAGVGARYGPGPSTEPTIPGRGYHKETIDPHPVKSQNAVSEWEKFLGDGPYTNKHPRTGQPDPDRLVSADGKRSIRYGDHEMNSPPNKHHYHEETWTYDPDTHVMNVDNTVKRVPLKPPKGKK